MAASCNALRLIHFDSEERPTVKGQSLFDKIYHVKSTNTSITSILSLSGVEKVGRRFIDWFGL